MEIKAEPRPDLPDDVHLQSQTNLLPHGWGRHRHQQGLRHQHSEGWWKNMKLKFPRLTTVRSTWTHFGFNFNDSTVLTQNFIKISHFKIQLPPKALQCTNSLLIYLPLKTVRLISTDYADSERLKWFVRSVYSCQRLKLAIKLFIFNHHSLPSTTEMMIGFISPFATWAPSVNSFEPTCSHHTRVFSTRSGTASLWTGCR